ncbi:Peptidase_M48 domain-containing protein [Rubrivivax sp. A210]|uniref:M48 family metalloprotease n=1 Tax=Rubrivivax sp. A210 TaxID=2772301 RepID=UPI0019976818|nr:M48 family metalloprotease [Rubrivivax sp. A210]CAD5373205.1 Peptidase_M48 domain-containing protein [Rubrivivax sp. A210]
MNTQASFHWRHWLHWRRLLALLLALLCALSPAGAQVRLPSLGESASDDLSIGSERRIGDQIMREGRRDPAYLDDPVLLAYVQSLWKPLLAAARAQGNIEADADQAFAWEIFLVRDRSVNAFALPGGFVGMHLGLIAITTTGDQLASVIAHELSHVTQRHIARSIAPAQRASLLAVAAFLLGVLAASRSSNMDMANAAIMGGQGVAAQGQLNFSRDVEREADRLGYGVLAAAGFNPAGMAGMFERMDAATRLNDSGGFPYLRSHPMTVDRISEARNRTLLAGGPPSRATLQHALMQMRARVLMDDGAQTLQRYNGETASPALADRAAAAYAGAMASSQLGDAARAEALAATTARLLATAEPREPAAERSVALLQAQIRLARGDAPAALAALDTLAPGDDPRPAMLLRARAQLELQRRQPDTAMAALRDATGALQTWVAEQPQDATAWELLSETSQALGLRLRSMRAAAEARAVLGDLGGAIDRLRAAQQVSRSATGQDFIEASVIDARLRQFTAQRRQLVLEARGGRGGEEPPPQ